MKTANIFCAVLTLAALTMTSLSMADDANDTAKETDSKSACTMKLPPVQDFAGTTVAYVMSSKQCSIFAKAIHESGLEEMLAGATTVTIFAPSDKAFEKWSKEDLDALFACKGALGALVLNHVCPKNLSPEKIKECCEKIKKEFREECMKIFGKENEAKCEELCKAIKEKLLAKIHEKMSDGDDDKSLDGEGQKPVKCMPVAIIKCNNGYVYVIDHVRVPRGLRVYKKLKAAQASPVVMIETVEISGSFIPEDGPASDTNQTPPEGEVPPKSGT